jgi:hypothetical protein
MNVPTLKLLRGSADELCPLLSLAALSRFEPLFLFKPTPSPTPSPIPRAAMMPNTAATMTHRFLLQRLSWPAGSSQSSPAASYPATPPTLPRAPGCQYADEAPASLERAPPLRGRCPRPDKSTISGSSPIGRDEYGSAEPPENGSSEYRGWYAEALGARCSAYSSPPYGLIAPPPPAAPPGAP